MRKLVTIGILLFLAGNPVSAQEPLPLNQEQMFGVFLASPIYRDHLQNAVNASEPPPLKARCEALKLLDSSRYTVIDAPEMVRNGSSLTLAKGIWISYPTFDACGTRVGRRMLERYIPETNTLKPIRLLPGDFIGDLRLESDARNIVSVGLLLKANCSDPKTLYYLDIKNKPTDEPNTRIETWTANACGNDVELDVRYTRVDGKTLIDAKAR